MDLGVCALVDFLAEVTVRDKTAPIIFDDPISSLDYKRMLHVVQRLVELSRTRQIIVFTHNIWCVVEVMRAFEKRKDQCGYYEIMEGDGVKGVVNKGLHPRADTWTNLSSRINSTIVEAKNASGVTRDALVQSGYSLIRSICEVLV